MRRCGISLEALADYREGRASESVKAQIQEHLDRNCADCRQNLAWLQDTTNALRAAHTVQVPEAALQRASALFRERFRPAVAPHPIQSWLARLQFDSRNNSLALAGARGAKREGVQLVYSTDMHDIELFQEPNEQGDWYVIGSIMPRAGDATIVPQEIVLTGQNGHPLTFTPDGEEFHLPSVPEGVYDIALRLAEGDITLTDVGVGQ